jgi:single-stranded-DNA-specific exonuclease
VSDDLARLTAPFADFVRRLAPGRPVAVLGHSDGDGLAAGAILAKALERAGHAVAVEVTGKGGGAWSPGTADAVARHRPQALVVADLGCRPVPVLPGVPTVFIDHHRPDGVPPGDVLVTGYGLDPTPTSGLLAWECGKHVADVSDLDWIAAISLLSDIGDAAPFELMRTVRERHRITHLRDATALLNAPRRSATGDARPALELLLKAGGPKDVTAGPFPEVELLKRAKAEVAAAFAEAKKVGPKVVGDVALVRVHSPCQVHPMVAQIWRTRLAKNIVLVANSGYLPGRVNFAMRTATDRNLLDFLAEHRPDGAGEDYGKGHDRATGGSLPFAVWDRFIASLGFGPEAFAPQTGP